MVLYFWRDFFNYNKFFLPDLFIKILNKISIFKLQFIKFIHAASIKVINAEPWQMMRILSEDIIRMSVINILLNNFHSILLIRVIREFLLWICLMTHFIIWLLFHSVVKLHLLSVLINFEVNLFDRHCSKIFLRWTYIGNLFIKIDFFDFENLLHYLKLIKLLRFFIGFDTMNGFGQWINVVSLMR